MTRWWAWWILLSTAAAKEFCEWHAAGPGAESNADACAASCGSLWFPWSQLEDNKCRCSSRFCATARSTGVRGPGPPASVHLSEVTDTSARLQWSEPEARDLILGYQVNAQIIYTHSSRLLEPLSWLFSNNTFQTLLTDLHPGTIYNITVHATSPDGPGAVEAIRLQTQIGIPDPAPPSPEIIEHRFDYMVIRIPKAINNNGPITFYRVIVLNEDKQRGFMPELLKSYNDSVDNGIPYYIAAEFGPFNEEELEFTLGNRKRYNGYYNAPLPHSKDIRPSIGIISMEGDVRKERYANTHDFIIFNVEGEEETSGPVMALGAAIAIGVVLLIIGVGVVIVLRRKIKTNKRKRLTHSMAMTGPCVEIENAGFIGDDEEKVDHYANLKRQLWNIPKNFLEIDNSTYDIGNFGKFVRGRVQHHGAYKPVSVQAIPDRELTPSEKKIMLSELDSLIKSEGHENVVALIGICELPEILYVAIEDSSHILKDQLIASRQKGVNGDKFSLIPESAVFEILTGIARGMEFLARKKILHKRLCCKNIVVVNGSTPKIGGFGLSHIHPVDAQPDYTRWTAQEMFKQTHYVVQCDVWSFGCLAWEVLALGGTLYPDVPNNSVPARVSRGMRPTQISYIGDELYQICSQCWQSDIDERPTFAELYNSLMSCSERNYLGLLSFSYYSGFTYELHIPEYEIVR